jgi:hypothetical protein
MNVQVTPSNSELGLLFFVVPATICDENLCNHLGKKKKTLQPFPPESSGETEQLWPLLFRFVSNFCVAVTTCS